MNMQRRPLIAIGLPLLAAPGVVLAQAKEKVWRVGWLINIRRPDSDAHFTNAFPRGMRELGYVEGKTLVIERRYSDGNAQNLPGMAAELVQMNVDVLVSGSSLPTAAAQKATSTIPIVFLADGDPVGNGFVASLARPGGNITGLSTIATELNPKLLELLGAMVHKLVRVAVLSNPDEGLSAAAQVSSLQAAGKSIGANVLPFAARDPKEVENAFAQILRSKAEGLVLIRGAFLNSQARLVAELAARHRLPTIAALTEFTTAGGLISYGPNLSDMFRRGATYVDKILKGAKPADLPVEQPRTFELVINLKAAKALGITVPQSLLLRADEVIP